MVYSRPETLGETHPRGFYFALEGSEGCGKSTQAARLAQALDAQLTRETGGTVLGQQLRHMLHDPSQDNIDPMAELFMVAADRAQHISQVVKPHLDAGRNLVSDRFWGSTIAYQGFGRGLNIDEIISITKIATREYFMPDGFFVFEVTKDELARRLSGRELDRFEQAGEEFHQRVAEGYNYLVEEFGGIRINGAHDPDRITATLVAKCGEIMLGTNR